MNKDDMSLQRGSRLRQLRTAANLTTIQLADLAGLNRTSITYWENAARGGLHSRGAEKIINGLKSINIECDIGWLLVNSGPPPKIIQEKNKSKDNRENTFFDKARADQLLYSLEEETRVFLNLNKDSLIIRINDDSMLPIIKEGNFVGGVWKNISALTKNDFYIIKVEDETYVKKLVEYKKTLIFQNLNKNKYIDEKKYLLKEVNKIAPVIRIWK